MDYSSKLLVINKSIKGGCQSRRKVVTHISKSDLPLTIFQVLCMEKNTYCMRFLPVES